MIVRYGFVSFGQKKAEQLPPWPGIEHLARIGMIWVVPPHRITLERLVELHQ